MEFTPVGGRAFTRRLARSIAALALATGVAATLAADASRDTAAVVEAVPHAELRAISTKLEGGRSTVLIESSEPVAYVTSQPDPLTVLVDLRNVKAGMLPPGILGPLPPVSNVAVNEAVAGDGAQVARVRVSLAHAASHRVRSARNMIYVEVDRPVVASATAMPVNGIASAPAGINRPVSITNGATRPAAMGTTTARSATAIRQIRPFMNGSSVGIAVVADGRLAATVTESKDASGRLQFDFNGVAVRGAAAITEINKGDIARVRVNTSSLTPLVTRLAVDLTKKTSYRLEQSGANGEELHILFDDQAPDAVTAAAPPQTPATPQPPVGPPPPAIVPVPPTQERTATPGRFTGHLVTLDFQGADLRSVLRTFAEISGLNIVIDPTITGSVDVSLVDVPWDQALDIILKANKLGYAIDGTVVRIAPLTVLAQEEEERRKLADAQALSGELRVVTLPLSYAKAPDLVPILTRSALSTRGEVQVDARTNTLIVKDLPDRLTTATELIRTLDRPQPQVEIEARIVQTTRDFARAIGVEWGFNGKVDPALGNTTGLAFPNNGSLRGAVGGAQGPSGGTVTDTGVNLRAPAPSSALGVALGAVNGAFNLDFVLSQLESSGRGRLLSTPRVSTQNNVEAEMTQGIEIPIQTVANNTVTVSFKPASLTLRVTPQITASNTVILRVFLENASPDFSRQVNGIPPIDTQRAVTSVLVADGETTVIGGIYLSLEQASNDRVPLLHRVPLLGWLFKRDTLSDESRELLIFITPRITRS
jgi:type IV pilus secretin PilQ/predicted competence protein